MNRRSFLGLFGKMVALVAVPSALLRSAPVAAVPLPEDFVFWTPEWSYWLENGSATGGNMRYIKPGSPTLPGSEFRKVTKFTNLTSALKELEPFIRDARHLQVGDEFKKFGGLRSRELLGNWLLCVACNANVGEDSYTFTSDPGGGDGLIVDETNGTVLETEHVLVPGPHPGAPEGRRQDEPMTLILESIAQKNDPKYAGKTLIVLCNDAGTGAAWHPNKVARALPDGLPFEAVCVIALQGVFDGSYIYGVTWLHMGLGNAPTWQVRIAPDFGSWRVEAVQ